MQKHRFHSQKTASLLVAFLCGILVFSPSTSAKTIVDRVVAVVGGKPILQSEIGPSLTQAAIESRIRQALIENDCKKSGLEATEEEVADSIKGVKKQNHLNDAEFSHALFQQGITLEAYKEQLKEQLCKMKLVQSKVKSRVQISEQDVKTLYESTYGLEANDFKVHLYHILFPLSPSSEKMARSALREIQSGKTFFAVAHELERAQKGVLLKDLGFAARGELYPEFEKLAFSVDVGKVAGPLRSPGGWHLLYVSEHAHVEKIPLERVEKELRRQLFEKEVERVFEQYVDELRGATYVEVHHV